MIKYNFDNFDVFCFKDFTDSDGKRKSYKFMQRDDIIVSLSKDNFINDLRNIPIEKVDYLQHYKKFVNRSMVNLYDELIESREEIEALISDSDCNECDTFIVRKNKD